MRRSPAILLARVGWALAILCIALAATGLQLDWQSRRDLTIAAWVPEPFRQQALQGLAADAYGKGHVAQGLALSRRFVLHRPVPAEGLGLLTTGLIASGDQDQGLAALILAGQRGWRDVFTQHLMASAAIQSGEMDVAAQRLAALWRIHNQDAQTRALTLDLLNATGGAQALERNVLVTDRWGSELLVQAAGDHVPVATWDALALTFATKGTALDCRRLSDTLRTMALTGHAQSAAGIWPRICHQDQASSPANFDFTPDADVVGPFDWRYPAQGGLGIQVVETAGRNVLQYQNSENVRQLLGTRIANLAAGRHVARLTLDPNARKLPGSITLRVNCVASTGQVARISSTMFVGGTVDFDVPGNDCAGQELSLLVGNGEGAIARLSVD